RLVASPVAGCTQPLGLVGEALPDQRGVEGAHAGGDGGHPVLPAPHGDVALLPCLLVTTLLPVGIGGGDRGGGGVVPRLGARAVEVGQAAGELSIRLEALCGGERGEGARGGMCDGAGDLRGGERAEHLGHVRDQAALGGEGVGRGGG